MSTLAVVALIGVDGNGRTDERSIECDTLVEAAAAIVTLEREHPEWRAITICRIEDFPAIMDGATSEDGGG